MRYLVVVGVLLASACARPIPLREDWMLRQVNGRYQAFYPSPDDPDPGHDAALLRPRFGLPAIAQTGAPFDIELLLRGGPHPVRAALLLPHVTDDEAAACLLGQEMAGCYPLELHPGTRSPVSQGAEVVVHSARPLRQPPAGGYDLYVSSAVDVPARVPRAVWLRAEDPARLQQLRVVHLTDLHVGKKAHGDPTDEALIERLRGVIREANALHPDLVVITGDITNRGQDPTLAPRARALLLGLSAPVLAIMGNHDIGFRRMGMVPDGYNGAGWANFARTFHPFLHFAVSLGGYDFVGFDSGPSQFSPRVLTRGLGPASLDELRTEVLTSQRAGHRGVVLFSHAPSRAALFTKVSPFAAGSFGRMDKGRAAFEDILLQAAARGQRVLHLAGHTHWSDVFEAQPRSVRRGRRAPKKAERAALRFARWPHTALGPCLQPIQGRAAIINTQAAAHSGLRGKANARGYGFSFLVLSDGAPEVAFRRYGVGQDDTCPDTQLAQGTSSSIR